jgi:hypothetical protein
MRIGEPGDHGFRALCIDLGADLGGGYCGLFGGKGSGMTDQ